MPVQNSTLRYGSVAMTLHWLIAAFVIANLAIGLYMSDLPRSDPSKLDFISWHKSIGLTVLTLSILRLVWRLINPVPPPPAGLNPWIRLAVRRGIFFSTSSLLQYPWLDG